MAKKNKKSVIGQLSDHQKFYVTLIAQLSEELLKNQIITPTQKYEMMEYVRSEMK